MKELSPSQEILVNEFAVKLQHIRTVDDLFPPDSGVREPVPAPKPHLPDVACLCMATLQEAVEGRLSRLAQATRAGARAGKLIVGVA